MIQTTFDPALKNYFNMKTLTPLEKIRYFERRLISEFNVNTDFLTRKTRKQEYVSPRYILFFLIIKEKCCGPSELQRITGRDHASVIHGCRSVTNYIESYKLTGKGNNYNFDAYLKILI